MLEDLGVEVHEDLYKASVVPATKNCDLNKKYFKSYFDAKDRYSCSLIETREFVSDGTTGLKTWYRTMRKNCILRNFLEFLYHSI